MRYLSHSEYRAWKTCRRAWWLRYHRLLALTPELEPTTGVRELGIRVHLALEAYYGYNLEPIAVLHAIYDELIAQRPHDVAPLRLERGYAVTMVRGYLTWAAENGTDALYDVVATEADVSYPLDPDEPGSVVLRGHLDQVVRDRGPSGALLVRDFKTVGSLVRGEELRRDEQLRFYALLQWLRAQDTGDRVDGALYTMLLRSRQTSRARGPFFQTLQVRYNETDHRSMLTRVRAVSREIGDAHRLMDEGADHNDAVYPTSSAACRWCDFARVCTLADDGSRFDDALAEMYRSHDPYDYYGSQQIDHVRLLLGAAPAASAEVSE